MAVKIRLTRGGAKKRPYYRIVVAEQAKSRDGRFIEKIGAYNPLLPKTDASRLTIRKDRAEYWLSSGAIPSERVLVFFNQQGIGQGTSQVKKLNERRAEIISIKKKQIEAKAKADAAAAAKAEAEAAEAAAAKAKADADAAATAAPAAEAPAA
jgi:small subunit ribosomal protein S16